MCDINIFGLFIFLSVIITCSMGIGIRVGRLDERERMIAEMKEEK